MNKHVSRNFKGLSKLKFFLALSRTPHGVLDMTTPCLGALLCLGTFPPLHVVVLGIMTTVAGYTAVYALNDVIDCRVDKKKFERGGFGSTESYLDAFLPRHPLAQGFLSFGEGLTWVAAWAALSVLGSYLLNPVCTLIFVMACILETVYCLMWKMSHLRTLISGMVKTAGGVAAVFAVNPHPSPWFVAVLFLCLFFWEIGGQNIPADWTDIEEDRSCEAKSIPLIFGPKQAIIIIIYSLILAIIMTAVLFALSPVRFALFTVPASLGIGLYLLLRPAFTLYKTRKRHYATTLFNNASYYPMALFLLALITLVI